MSKRRRSSLPQRMFHESTSSGQRADTGLTVSAAPVHEKPHVVLRAQGRRVVRQPRLHGTGRMHRPAVSVAAQIPCHNGTFINMWFWGATVDDPDPQSHNLPASSSSSKSADSLVFVAPERQPVTTVLRETQRKATESLSLGMTFRKT
jgi:hypothetical protein